MAEVSYVGNRGAYFPAPNMDQIASKYADAGDSEVALRNRHQQCRRPGAAHQSDQQCGCSGPFPRNSQLVPVNGTLTVPSVYKGFPAAQNLIQALRGSAAVGWCGTVAWTADGQDLVRFDAGEGDQAVFTRAAGCRQLHLGQGQMSSGRLPTAPTFWPARP